MTIEQMMLQSEALIFGSDRPITVNDIEQILKDSMNEEEAIDKEKLSGALDAIVEKYASDFYWKHCPSLHTNSLLRKEKLSIFVV